MKIYSYYPFAPFLFAFAFSYSDSISFRFVVAVEKEKKFLYKVLAITKDRRKKKKREHYGSNMDMVQQKKATNVSSRRSELDWLLLVVEEYRV